MGRAVRALQTREMEQLRTICSLDRLRCNRRAVVCRGDAARRSRLDPNRS